MSFRCQRCGGAFPNKEHDKEWSPTRVVSRTRSFVGVSGSQIEQELICCTACAAGVVPKHVHYSVDSEGRRVIARVEELLS